MDTGQPLVSRSISAHSCNTCSIRCNCLAGGLEGRQLDKFESYRGCVRILRNGQHLFRNGDIFNAIYVIRSGMLKVTVITDDGGEQITGFYLPGEILGIDGIENGCYRTTAIALETSSICILPFQKLVELGLDFPSLQKQLWRHTSREIFKSQDLILSMGRKNAEARLARFLLSLSRRLREIGYSPVAFNLPMGRHEIGNFLGMTLETVSRVLTRFEKSGYIKKERRNIHLIDPEALEVISNGKPCENIAEKTGCPGNKIYASPAAVNSWEKSIVN